MVITFLLGEFTYICKDAYYYVSRYIYIYIYIYICASDRTYLNSLTFKAHKYTHKLNPSSIATKTKN